MTTRLIAILSGTALVLALVAMWLMTFRSGPEDAFAACRGGAVSGGAGAIGGPFELVREDGETVSDQDVFTKPTILYFGYTFCPDVCPLDNQRNAEANYLLDERGYDVQTAFISIDPDRDTPEVMAEFTDLFHPSMVGLTGSREQVQNASKAYRTYYKKQDEGDPEYYLMDHSTFTYLVFPDIGFVDFFKREDSPEEMAARVACFVDASR